MNGCRYDQDAGDYLRDGEPCRVDDYGDPTHHCTARRSCANHVGRNELTCARCITRARSDLRRIPQLAALMLPVALGVGVNSEAANMAGPAADPRDWSARRVAMVSHLDAWLDRELITERQYVHAHLALEDDDEWHPYSVLTRWQMMLAEDYDHPLPPTLSTVGAAAYLDRQLHVIAQDPGQDFPLLARELRRCRSHLETVMSDSRAKERGVPCPACAEDERFVRLVREYAHWCEDEDCERIHYDSDEADEWVCPRNHAHRWTHEDYRNRLVERQAARA